MTEQADISSEKRLASRLCSLLDVYKDFSELTDKYDQMCGEDTTMDVPSDEVYADAAGDCLRYSQILANRILAQSDYLLQRCATRYFELDQLTENEKERN